MEVSYGSYGDTGGRGRGRHTFRGGRGRGRGWQSYNKATVECYKCHQLGHFQYECPNLEKTVNYAEMSKDEEMLLMAYIEASEEKGHIVWFLDSGCSNHMSGDLSLFCTMEEGFKREVSLGNHMKMKVVGKGSIRLNLAGVRHVVQEVFYIPELKNNLLSIGQLQEKGLAFLIKNNECKIYHPSKVLILESIMTLNKMFILLSKTSSVANKSSECCFQTDIHEIAHLWHCRDVVFEENKKWDWNTSHSEFRNDQLEWGDMDITIADQESDTVTPQDQSKHEETIEYSGDIGHSTDENEEVENAAGIEIATEDENAVATTESSAVEGQRIRRTPRWMDDYVVNSIVANSDIAASFDPQYFDEAVLNNNWKKAMDAEIQSIEKNGTWTLVELPKGAGAYKLNQASYPAAKPRQKHTTMKFAVHSSQENDSMLQNTCHECNVHLRHELDHQAVHHKQQTTPCYLIMSVHNMLYTLQPQDHEIALQHYGCTNLHQAKPSKHVSNSS
ncbi:hypothetical protein KIW84_042781 [Lathyrus oleraceus]|uniref:CCHC-type domain-containing protein n=1 Tax=Pisum sativum TaxID=3888 RepID=A0A9D4XDL2_PEA|nr:hypothetical protein KIW84_042781 [Pisum sativum]